MSIILSVLLSTAAYATPDLVIDDAQVSLNTSGYSVQLVVKNTGTTASGSFYVDLVADERILGLWGSGYIVDTVSPGPTPDPATVAYMNAKIQNNYLNYGITDPGTIAMGLMGSGYDPDEIAMGLWGSGYPGTDIASGLWGSGMSPTDLAGGLWGSGMNVVEVGGHMDDQNLSDTDIASGLWGSGMSVVETPTGMMAGGLSLDTVGAEVWDTSKTNPMLGDFSLEGSSWNSGLGAGATKVISFSYACAPGSCGLAITEDAAPQLDLWISLDIDGNVSESDESNNLLRVGFDGAASGASGQVLDFSDGTSWTSTVTTPYGLDDMWAAYGVTLGTTMDVEDLHLDTLDI